MPGRDSHCICLKRAVRAFRIASGLIPRFPSACARPRLLLLLLNLHALRMLLPQARQVVNLRNLHQVSWIICFRLVTSNKKSFRNRYLMHFGLLPVTPLQALLLLGKLSISKWAEGHQKDPALLVTNAQTWLVYASSIPVVRLSDTKITVHIKRQSVPIRSTPWQWNQRQSSQQPPIIKDSYVSTLR